MTDAKGCPVQTAFDELMALDPDRVRCPYPLYEQLRNEEPLYFSERLNCYVVSRYDDLMTVITDPNTFSSIHQSGPSSVSGLAARLKADPNTSPKLLRQVQRRLEINAKPALINADPPLHVRQRKLVSQGFTPRRVGLMEPEIRQVATGLLDAVAASGSMEFVSNFAMPLPMTVIANVLGVPPERQLDFKRWSTAFTRGVGALDLSGSEIEELFDAVDEFYDYFTEQIELRRSEPRDDLLTDLVNARLEGEQPLTLNEMLQMLVVFLVGGNETTTSLLTWMTHRLLTDPELMAQVRSDPALLPELAEEMLRLEAPIQGLFRTATVDTEVGGVKIPRGAMLWMVYGSANHDPEVFAAPEKIDLNRPGGKPHLAFGRGEHFCLGASIARLEAKIGMELLLERFDDLTLVGSPVPQVHPSFIVHGIRELLVTFTPH